MAKKKPKVRPGRFGISSADVVIVRGPDEEFIKKRSKSTKENER